MIVPKKVKGFGYCEYHDEPIEFNTYEWKGCWGCHYFIEGEDFPYTFVSNVAKELGVSENTIRRWIKKEKLKADLLEQIRRTDSLPAPRKYHIEKESVEELMKKLKEEGHHKKHKKVKIGRNKQ